MDWFQGKVGILVRWGHVSGFGGLWRRRLTLLGRCRRPLELWFLSFSHPTLAVVSLWTSKGGYGGVGPGRGGKRDSTRGGAVVIWPLLLLLVLLLGMVLFEADVPGQAADRGHRLELVDDVPRDEVDVVVAELDTDVADAFPPQLVELGIVHPLDALQEDTRCFRVENFKQYTTPVV